MKLRFMRFSQGLAQDPITHRIWFGIAMAYDFERYDDIIEERLALTRTIELPFFFLLLKIIR